MSFPGRGSRVVFVGNIPYDMSEEQLIDVFREVGKVTAFRLVFDRNTGKPRGYGFCEFEDAETAASAVRNLNEIEIRGRPLRISHAEEDPQLEGKTTNMGHMDENGVMRPAGPGRRMGPMAMGAGGMGSMGPGMGAMAGGMMGGGGAMGSAPTGPAGYGMKQEAGWGGGGGGVGGPPKPFGLPTGPASAAAPPQLPPNMPLGQPLPPGVTSTDAISQTLAALPPNQLLDAMSQMKGLCTTSPDQARTLLSSHPQLAYALFQAMLMMNVVDPSILQRMLPQTGMPTGPPPPSGPAAGAYDSPYQNTPPQGRPLAGAPPSVQPYSGAPHAYGGMAQPPPPAMAPQQQAQQQQPPPYGSPHVPQSVPQPGYYGAQQGMMQPPPGGPMMAGVPPPPSATAGGGGGVTTDMDAATKNLPPDQKELLMQVLQLTDEQINALPQEQRAGILQLRAQLGR